MDSTNQNRKIVIRSDMFMSNAVKSLGKRNVVYGKVASSKVVMPEVLSVG